MTTPSRTLNPDFPDCPHASVTDGTCDRCGVPVGSPASVAEQLSIQIHARIAAAFNAWASDVKKAYLLGESGMRGELRIDFQDILVPALTHTAQAQTARLVEMLHYKASGLLELNTTLQGKESTKPRSFISLVVVAGMYNEIAAGLMDAQEGTDA